jgi:hypothetical protein
MDARKGAGVKQSRAAVEQIITIDDMGYQTPPQTVVWQEIATAPQDGRPLMMKPGLDADGPGTPAIWHRTRRWLDSKWQNAAFWANPVTKWPLNFEPRFWRLPVYGEKR